MPEVDQDKANNAADAKGSMEISDKLIQESGGLLKAPSTEEMERMNKADPIYVNKFLCALLRNNMIKLGFAMENNEQSSVFQYSIITDVQSLANLHQLLTKVLTSFQQQQMQAMQALQGKVNPAFVEQMKAAQEAAAGLKKPQ